MEEIIRKIEVFVRQLITFLRKEGLSIIIGGSILIGFSYMVGFLSRDRTAKDQNFFSNETGARDEFYESYERSFIKQNQRTIDNGLTDWVDAKMVKLGYVKYKSFFYKDGIKIYYDELPKNDEH